MVMNVEQFGETMLPKVYNSLASEMQEFRTSMAKIMLAFLGMTFLFVGWAVVRQEVLPIKHKLILSLGIMVVVLLGLVITRLMRRYFTDIASAIVKIQDTAGMFTRGHFVEEQSILPEHWQSFGTSQWKEPIFTVAYMTISLSSVFAVTAIWLI